MAQFYSTAPQGGGYGQQPPPQQHGGYNQGGAFYGGPQQGGQPPNFFNGAISPEMLNLGFNAGKNMLNAQRDQWMPGVSTFWSSLKIYFAVADFVPVLQFIFY